MMIRWERQTLCSERFIKIILRFFTDVPKSVHGGEYHIHVQSNSLLTEHENLYRKELNIMKYTSSEANKLLRKLNSDYRNLIRNESQSRTFLAATGEDPESVRPLYDYEKTKEELAAFAAKITMVKHALNVFNSTTKVDGFDMTIDEMLVVLPMISERVRTLDSMRSELPKARERTFGSGTNAVIDYRYVNYDIDKAAADYDREYAKLTAMQNALDIVNNTKTMDIDI